MHKCSTGDSLPFALRNMHICTIHTCMYLTFVIDLKDLRLCSYYILKHVLSLLFTLFLPCISYFQTKLVV